MSDPNIKVILDLKVEIPGIIDEELLNKELKKELEICKEYLLDKLSKLVEKSGEIKIYQESA